MNTLMVNSAKELREIIYEQACEGKILSITLEPDQNNVVSTASDHDKAEGEVYGGEDSTDTSGSHPWTNNMESLTTKEGDSANG